MCYVIRSSTCICALSAYILAASLYVFRCNYLSHYILHSFLPEEFTNAAKIHEVRILFLGTDTDAV